MEFIYFLELTCSNRINMVIMMDSHSNVGAANWPHAKQVVASLITHMQLASDKVTVSIINFGETAQLEIPWQSYRSQSELLPLIYKLIFISGRQRMDLALELGNRLLQSGQKDKSSRNILLLVTNTINSTSSVDDTMKETTNAMKDQGIEIFMLIAGPAPSRQHLEMSSKPLAKYLLLVSDINSLSEMGTVTARAICHNVN